jgi:hypothetical protein
MLRLRHDIDTSVSDKLMPESARYLMSDKKRGWIIQFVEVRPASGGLNVYLTGDVPMPRENVNKASRKLRLIEGCTVLDVHKHANNTEQDIHPICFFTSRNQAEEKLEKVYDWANTYGFKPGKEKFWREEAQWEKVIK